MPLKPYSDEYYQASRDAQLLKDYAELTTDTKRMETARGFLEQEMARIASALAEMDDEQTEATPSGFPLPVEFPVDS